MRAFHADVTPLALPPGHRFPAAKYGLLRAAVAERLPQIAVEVAPLATEGELALAHDPRWIEAVLEGRLSAAAQRELGFPWSPQMVERSRRSVGATISAARAALMQGQGVAANLAGGTHHADAHKGSGWCVFNDVAVAARLMQSEAHRLWRSGVRRMLRVWVIDLDVHQGNGTAAIFRDDPSVYTLSVHAERNFPFRKEPSDLDVGLPDGCGDDDYLAALDDALARSWAAQAASPPGLAFYLAGADPHEDDRLGLLRLTENGLAERDRRVFDFLHARRVPVAVTMAGGYNADVACTVRIHCRTLERAAEAAVAWAASARA